MSQPIPVHTFILQTERDVQAFFEHMRALDRPALARENRFVQITVAEVRDPMTHGQRKYMWVGILNPMEEQAVMPGIGKMRAKDWHLFSKILHLPETCAKGIAKWKYTDDGRELQMSTGDLNHDEMHDYLERVAAWAATDFGVHLPSNPRDGY